LHNRSTYLVWVIFGAVWGSWGADLPQLRAQAHVDDGELGTALLFIGLGALPAMALTGRAIDRWGRAVPAATISALGLAAVGVALGARDQVSLGATLLVLGASSGAADVSINALSGLAERVSARPIIARSHGTFSAAVVGASLLAGGLRLAGAPLVTPFAIDAAGALLAAGYLLRHGAPLAEKVRIRPARATSVRAAFIPAGLVAAIALAVENAHQSWSALFLTDDLHLRPGWTAAAPALFAAVVALVRFGSGPLSRRAPIAVLLGGAALTAAGTLTLAAAHTAALALVGLAVAAAGTAALYPTLLSLSLGQVDEATRGRATATVSATAYLGFLVGPVFVGGLASLAGLRVAFAGVAILAVVFGLAAMPVSRYTARATAR
jgi:Major Facilitator Superfamily